MEENNQKKIVLGAEDLDTEREQTVEFDPDRIDGAARQDPAPAETETGPDPEDTDSGQKDGEESLPEDGGPEEEDRGEEKDPRRSRLKKLTAGLCVLLAACIGLFVYFLNAGDQETVVWGPKTVEYGTKDPVLVQKINNDGRLLSLSGLDTYKTGDHIVKARVEEDGKIKEYEQTFSVEDTQAPVITTERDTLAVEYGDAPRYADLKIKAVDPVDGPVSYSIDGQDLSSIGTHEAVIRATDCNKNKTEKKIKIRVKGYVKKEGLAEYRSLVSRLNENYKADQRAKKQAEEQAKKAARQQKLQEEAREHQSKDARIIWVGDSRFVGMQYAINGGSAKDVFVAQGSMGYNWMVNTAIPAVNSQLREGDVIVVNLGVNGFGAEEYYHALNQTKATDWKDHRVIFMSVNPIDDQKAIANNYYVTNAQVIDFNSKMRANLEDIEYMDTYSLVYEDLASNTADGVHYTVSTYNMIYEAAKQAIYNS